VADTKLRSYQIHALELIENSYARGAKAPLLCMPCASGKTVTAATYVANHPEKRFLWIGHTRELLLQAAETFRRVGIRDFVVITETPRRPIDTRVVICGIDRLRLGSGLVNDPDVIIVDECHLFGSPQRFATLSRFSRAKLLGLSATPSRSDMNTLDRVFDAIFHPVHNSDLLREGNLVPIQLYGAEDRTRVDWAKSGEHDWAPYVAYRKYCKGKRTIVFTNKTQQSKIFLKFLEGEGVNAAEVSGAMPKPERDRVLREFSESKYEAIVNVRVLVAGYDFPELQAIMLLSPSLERTTYLQVVGRVARTAPGKTHGVICDMSGAFKEHGLPLEDSWWSLGDDDREHSCPNCGEEVKPKQWDIKKDASCETCVKTKSYGRHCPNCGWHYQKIEEEERKPRKELPEKEKKVYPQYLAEKITDFLASRAPTMYANNAGIQGRLKDELEREKVLEWQAENFNRDDAKTRQATYYALHSHRLFLERVRKRKYHPFWSEKVYHSHYGCYAPGHWKNYLPEN
jgi:superfamily II DNA or RNA helicase